MDKINRATIVLFSSLILCLLLPACKPTERGYQAAYDAALAKRQADLADMDIPIEGFRQEGEPFQKEIDGNKIYYLVAPLGAVAEGAFEGSPYNVVVGCYKMPVNALDQARKLRESGLNSFAARGEQEKFYVVASGFDTLQEAVEFYKEFLDSRPGYPIVGLPALTLLENSRSRR